MIGILSDKLIIIASDKIRHEMVHELNAALKDKGLDVTVIAVGFDTEIKDFRAAPPEVRDAARLVDEWLQTYG